MKGIFRAFGDGSVQTFSMESNEGRIFATPTDELPQGWLAPGFTDIHLHGAFGIDFMSATQAKMLELSDRLGEVGYERFYPTTVSASADDVRRALDNLPDDPRMPGFHLEGPFISHRFPGAQPPSAIANAPLTASEWDPILDDPRLKVITLAPEEPGSLELARRLASRGVRVSMGHTNATYAEAQAGFDAGVRHATHTFNAMRGLHHREAGALGFAMLNDQMVAELIYDRLHVTPQAATVLLRTKPADKVIAVSDSTIASGKPEGERFQMWGLEVETRPGSVYLADTETLAGSAITLFSAFQNLARDFGGEWAIRLCCVNPRTAMGIEAPPKVWLEFDDEFNLRQIHRV